jgi:hypothetical protein
VLPSRTQPHGRHQSCVGLVANQPAAAWEAHGMMAAQVENPASPVEASAGPGRVRAEAAATVTGGVVLSWRRRVWVQESASSGAGAASSSAPLPARRLSR